MNVSERRYVLVRLSEIEQAKVCKVYADVKNVRASVSQKTNKDVLNDLIQGKVKLRYPNNAFQGTLVVNVKESVFKFPMTQGYHNCRFNGLSSAEIKRVDKAMSKLDKRTKAIRAECTKVKDEVMLGDSQAALAMLAKFEQF